MCSSEEDELSLDESVLDDVYDEVEEESSFDDSVDESLESTISVEADAVDGVIFDWVKCSEDVVIDLFVGSNILEVVA